MAGGVEVGGGGGDATCAVEGDAKIAVGVRHSDRGAAKGPGGGGGWGGGAGSGGWVEINNFCCFCEVDIELGGEAEQVEGHQADFAGLQGLVLMEEEEEEGNSKASQGGGRLLG